MSITIAGFTMTEALKSGCITESLYISTTPITPTYTYGTNYVISWVFNMSDVLSTKCTRSENGANIYNYDCTFVYTLKSAFYKA